jgi:hypothetical protein
MPRALDPFRFVLIAVAGWMNQHQLQTIDYLREETGFCGSNWAGTNAAEQWPAAAIGREG